MENMDHHPITTKELQEENRKLRRIFSEIASHTAEIDRRLAEIRRLLAEADEGTVLLNRAAEAETAPATQSEIEDLLKKYSRL